MKKFIPLLLIAVLAFTACSDKNPYAGKYTGTFEFFKNNITSGVTKTGNMRFVSNPLNGGLLMYAVVPLDPAGAAGVYMTNSANMEYINALIQGIAGSNNIYDATTEQIKNVKIETKFNGSTVYCEMFYEITILSTLATRVSIVKFNGTKNS